MIKEEMCFSISKKNNPPKCIQRDQQLEILYLFLSYRRCKKHLNFHRNINEKIVSIDEKYLMYAIKLDEHKSG